jgi:hypothetical protein
MATTKKNTVESVFGPFIDEIMDLQTFIEVAVSGFGMAAQSLKIHELMKTSPVSPLSKLSAQQLVEERSKSEKLVDYAKREEKSGFSYIHELAITRLWSIVEAALDEVSLYCLKKHPQILESDYFKKIKAPIIEFLKLSKEDQLEHLLERFKNEVNSNLKIGMGQINSLMEPMGLTGSTPDQIARLILELQQIRHLLAHTNGKVDKRVLNRCPWIKFSMGEKLHITFSKFKQYHTAVFWLLLELDRRLRIKEGKEVQSLQIELLSDFLEGINKLQGNEQNKE